MLPLTFEAITSFSQDQDQEQDVLCLYCAGSLIDQSISATAQSSHYEVTSIPWPTLGQSLD